MIDVHKITDKKNLYSILLSLRSNLKPPCRGKKNNKKTRPVKIRPHHCKFEFYKVCAEWCRKKEEKGGGFLQPGYNTCEQVQEERHSFTRKWGWEPILPEGSEKTQWWVTECHANSLKQHNSAPQSEKANTRKQRGDIRPVAF